MYSAAQLQAAADQLGFSSIELVIEYFKAKMLDGGLYEELRAKA